MSLLVQSYDRLGVLLDPKTGRPKLEPPFDKPGVLYAPFNEPHIGDALERAPDHVKRNLDKAYSPFGARNSYQAWEETLYVPLADGATYTTPAAEATIFPIFTLPANYMYPGRVMRWTVMGRHSTVITTPGTTIFKLAFAATGLGGTTVVTSPTWTSDATAGATNLTFMNEYWTVCRANGTTGNIFGWGRIEWADDYEDAALANFITAFQMRLAPAATPATTTQDTTTAKALNPTYTPSVTTASMTGHIGILEAMT